MTTTINGKPVRVKVTGAQFAAVILRDPNSSDDVQVVGVFMVHSVDSYDLNMARGRVIMQDYMQDLVTAENQEEDPSSPAVVWTDAEFESFMLSHDYSYDVQLTPMIRVLDA